MHKYQYINYLLHIFIMFEMNSHILNSDTVAYAFHLSFKGF